MIICAADIHFRPDKPPCRRETSEEWIETQFRKFQYILDYSTEHDSAPIYVAGDFCHKATGWPAWMFSRLIRMIGSHDGDIYVIPGQHDLPYHQLDLLETSNLGVLLAAGILINDEVGLFPWGVPISPTGHGIAMTHQMVIKSIKDEIYPGQHEKGDAQTGTILLRKSPGYNLIVSGDNHQPFHCSVGNRHLVNPGSMTRQRTNERHAPGFYTYDAGMVHRIRLPHDEDAVMDSAPEKADHAIWGGNTEAVENMLNEMTSSEDLDFVSTLMEYFKQNNTRKEVQQLILGE